MRDYVKNIYLMKKITVKCPCCHATLAVDANTGLVISSKEHKKNFSFDEALKNEEEKKDRTDELFAEAMETEKKRAGELEDKFKSIMESRDELDEPPPRPIDLD